VTNVLLAMTDPILRNACSRYISRAGENAIALERPLSVLGLAARIEVDAVVADKSDLGRSAAVVAREVWPSLPVAVVGSASSSPDVCLPLAARAFLDALLPKVPEGRLPPRPNLRLDSAGHRALLDDNEIGLTATEYRLLEILLEHSPDEVSLEDALHELWGETSIVRGANLLRVHVRNLRTRLAAAGLRDAIQSRRGRGYALVI
jgi:DNA-binding response OmpR family regulator